MSAPDVDMATHAPPSSESLWSILRRTWRLLTPTERRELALLQPLVILTALLETLGVASIVPFLALLSDPSAIERNRTVHAIAQLLPAMSQSRFLFVVGAAVLVLLAVGNGVTALSTWLTLRFSWLRNHTLSTRLLQTYLGNDYLYFTDKNSADLVKAVILDVQTLVVSIIVQGLQLVGRIVVTAMILGSLLVLDPAMALGLATVSGGFYGATFLAVRRHLERIGREKSDVNMTRHRVVIEAFAGIKEVKVLGLESAVVRDFEPPSRRYAETTAVAAVVSVLPRFVLETVSFAGVLLIILYMLAHERPLQTTLPVLGLYAFSAYRLLPAMQTIFGALTSIRFALPTVQAVLRDWHDAPPRPSPPAVPFVRDVVLDDVTLTYPRAARPTLHGVSARIAAGEWVALVGPTGSGKTSLVDVLLGLIAPTTGALRVDDATISRDNVVAWQRRIAYVPQQIFLADTSIARNVSLGERDDAIDHARVREALRIACADEFVDVLPDGVDTVVGERGVKLSGGQRQRLGVARALYRRPALLVLDEATSALDGATEAAFFTRLRAALRGVTVISIAHRLATTRTFDRVLLIRAGAVAAEGTPDEAISGHREFAVLSSLTDDQRADDSASDGRHA